MKRLWCRRCKRYFKVPKPPNDPVEAKDFESSMSMLHQFVSEGYCCKCREPDGEIHVKRKRYWWYEVEYNPDGEWELLGGRNTKGDAIKLAKWAMERNSLDSSKIRIYRCWKETEKVEFT